MEFQTPFRIKNGMLLDRNWNVFPIRPVRCSLPETAGEAKKFLQDRETEKINFIQLELDESDLTETSGLLKEESTSLEVLDYFTEEAFQRGFYLGLTPLTKRCRIPDGRSEHAIRDDEPIFAERYLDSLFKHVNRISGRKFSEYENWAMIEPVISLETFSETRLWTWLHHLRAFIEHAFLNRLLNVYFPDRGPVPEKLREVLTRFGGVIPVDLFPDRKRLVFCPHIDGIRKAVFDGFVKQHGEGLWLPCATLEAASQSSYFSARENGGAEGWLSVESAVPVDFKFRFKTNIRNAVFRPSLRESVPVGIYEDEITFTLEKNRYCVLEVNYGLPEESVFTVYVFNDPVIREPEKAFWLEPGRHNELDYTASGTLAFRPGVHRLPGDRLRPVSGHDIYLAPGAVLKAGLTCEKGENIRIYGTGIFDGTEISRQPGENWKGRADDAFIHFFEGRNIVWDGPVIFNSPFWNLVPEGTHDMTIRHHKAVTWAVNTDGVQPRSCVNLIIEECFFKCADDAIAIKTRRTSGMHSKNILVRNIVTWNDAGSALEIGHTSQADILENVRFENIEIVRTTSGLCHMYLIDHSTVRNVRYENIYIERNLFGVPEISFTVSKNFYSTDDERGRIQDVLVRNLHVMKEFRGIQLQGFDEEHRVENVVVEGLFVHEGGSVQKIENEAELGKVKRVFADEIQFKR